jgi:probable F420-dependent oxidoreductase
MSGGRISQKHRPERTLMDLGIALPQWGKHASPEAIVQVAQAAERAGYASVWVQERLLRPLEPSSGYGGMEGVPIPEPYHTVYEPIETLTLVAAKTERVKLGTSVIDALFHVPLVLGKRIATLDRFSNGRTIIGLGQGWSEEEFRAANVPMKRRGAGFDDFIAAMRALWGPDPVEYKGRFYQVPKAQINPKPVQSGGPPLLVGAFTPAAVARAGKLGLGFNPINISWDFLEGMTGAYRAAATAAGHDPNRLPIIIRANNQITQQPLGDDRGPFSGTPDQIKADLDRTSGMGINHVFFDLGFLEAPISDFMSLIEGVRPS